MFNIQQASFLDLRSIASEHTDRLVAWIGSGLSQAAGLPSWFGLRDALLDELERKAILDEGTAKAGELSDRVTSIREQNNLWVAFDMLRKSLGQTTYTTAIRRALSVASSCPIPRIYSLLWKLPLAGVVNLNLDGLATRAYHHEHASRQLFEFNGKQTGDFTHILKSPYPFLLNLHGFHASASSWVLTNSERALLAKDQACSAFVDACLINRTVVFMGVTADDRAVKGYLDSLRSRKVDFGTHFWFTERKDVKADNWAEKAGVQLISYSADNSHAELLEGLSNIITHVPIEEDTPTPIAMTLPAPPDVSLPSPQDTGRLTPGEARLALNAHASRLLEGRNEESYKSYEEFSKEYGLAIHQAWYFKPPHNTVFGCELGERIGGGAFASVYEGSNTHGDSVAVKILREEILDSPAMFQSFRRGVQSMRILAQHSLAGIVPYQDASEIPASVVMELIDGPNLCEAVGSGGMGTWESRLRVACELAGIIRSAHLLPERVLHRDIRPSNIMLRGFFKNSSEWEVLVLDFDLSWHLGAKELSVLEHPALNGYLAPEQIDHMPGASTRNALVDSFGLGMTLYFLCSGKHPLSLEHRYTQWAQKVGDSIALKPSAVWQSLPFRYARIILNCTQDIQAARWDMTQIQFELERLCEACVSPEKVMSAELWAEEIAARASHQLQHSGYQWNPDAFTASIGLPRGVDIELTGDESNGTIHVGVTWMAKDGQNPEGIEKYLPAKCQRAEEALRKNGWKVTQTSQGNLYRAHFDASKTVRALQTESTAAVAGVCTAAEELRFGPHEA